MIVKYQFTVHSLIIQQFTLRDYKLVLILPQIGLLMEELLSTCFKVLQANWIFFTCTTYAQKQAPHITSAHLNTSKYVLHA